VSAESQARPAANKIDEAQLHELMLREETTFAAAHPHCRALFTRARRSLYGGVPMNWMSKWPGAFPVFVEEASGARFRCSDGVELVDLCLGDTGAMTGHAPQATLRAIGQQAQRGLTLMLPTEDSIWVGEELTRRFGLPYWQFALTATDANRFAIRLARMATGRPKILVFNGCYHGTVDETFISLQPDGSSRPRPGNIGPPVDPSVTTRVVEFNDVDALEAALSHGDVAAVLAEPVMTNIGIIHPDPGYHAALRDLTRSQQACSSSMRPTRSAPARAGTPVRRGWSRISSSSASRSRVAFLPLPTASPRKWQAVSGSSWSCATLVESAAPWPATRSRWRPCERPCRRC